MAGKGYVARIVGDASSFMKESSRVSGALDNLADAMQDMATSSTSSAGRAEKAIDKTGKAAKNAGKDTRKAGKDIGQAFDKAADSAEDSAKTTRRAFENLASKLSSDADRIREKQTSSYKSSGKAMEEVSDEIRQNWGETMSSFDGSAQSAVDMVADTFGGLAASLGVGGPVGSLVLGAIAAIASSMGSKWVDSFEKTKEANADMYQEMLENATAYFNDEQITKKFNDIMSGAEGALIDKKTLDRYVEATSMSAQDIALAFADTRSQQASDLSKHMQETQKKYDDAVDSMNNALTDNATDSSMRLSALANQYDTDLIDQWNEHTDAIDKNSESVRSNTDYLREHGYGIDDAGAALRDYAQAQAEAQQAATDTIATIQENNNTYGSATAAYTENQSALASLVETFNQQTDAAKAAGASSSELKSIQYEQAAAFLEAAAAAGIGAKDAANLAYEYGLIPKDVATDVAVIGSDKARQKSQQLKQEYERLPKNSKLKVGVEGDYSGISAVRSGLLSAIGVLRVPVQPTQSRGKY